MSELRDKYYEYLRNHTVASEVTLYVMDVEERNKEMLEALIKVEKKISIIEHPPGEDCPLCLIENAVKKQTGKKIEEILK